jgi:hypothetical protein
MGSLNGIKPWEDVYCVRMASDVTPVGTDMTYEEAIQFRRTLEQSFRHTLCISRVREVVGNWADRSLVL